MVGILGFEPSLTVSETVVQPITPYPYKLPRSLLARPALPTEPDGPINSMQRTPEMEGARGTAPRSGGSKPPVLLLNDTPIWCTA